MRRFREVLRKRDLRLLYVSFAVSAVGSWSYNVALLAFVYERTHSLGWVGATTLGRFVPLLVVAPYAGVIAERVERVGLLWRSDLLAGAIQAGLVLVAMADGSVTLAIVLGALTSIVTSVNEPAAAALTAQYAGEDDLVAANALRGTLDSLVIVVGPALGALMLALGSAAAVFAINAVSFVVSAAVIFRLRERSRPSDVTDGGTVGPLKQIADSIRAIREAPAAVPLLALCALASFLYGTDTVVLVAAADQRLGLGPDGFGLLLGGLGIGGLLMAPFIERASAAARLSAILIAGMAAYCLPTLVLALTTSPELGFAAQVIRGAGTLVVDVLAITAIQRAVAGNMVARVFGIFTALVLGSIALGTVAAPALSSALGLKGALVVLSVAPLALACLALPALLRIDQRAASRRATLAPRIAVLDKLGILQGASQAVLERLADAASEQDVAAGTDVVREGDPADAFYVVLDGDLDVTVRGEEAPVRTQGGGTWFGEIGLLGGFARTATVTATTDARLLRVDGDAFLDALTTTPPAGVLLEGARSRLARTHPSLRLDPALTTPAA
jgi:MFS family permease